MNCVNHPEKAAISKCTYCGNSICENCRVVANNEDYCRACFTKSAENKPAKGGRSPLLAALLSFLIAGAGQLYNGQAGKAILIYLGSWLVIPWLYGIFDGYVTAKKMNDGAIPAARPRTGCLIFLVIWTLLAIVAIFAMIIFAAVAVPGVIQKGFNPGEMEIQFEMGPFRHTGPAPAEVQAGAEAPAQPFQQVPSRQSEYVKVCLKNGQTFEAVIKRETEDAVIFMMEGGTFTIEKSDIERME